MFKFNPLYMTDGYKIAHKHMLALGTVLLYGTWIPRKVKYMPKGIDKIVSFGQQLVWQWLHDQFEEHFFNKPWEELSQFVTDMTAYLGLPYNGDHFKELHDLGYLPVRVKALPEGLETPANIPHMTFVNTVDGFGWLTLYLETIISAAAWKSSTSATLALKYRRNVEEWVMKTDPENAFLKPFLCHDFSARGMSPWDMITSGLGHSLSFRGSDTLSVIPASRGYYGVKGDEMPINSVNASEHSVTTTGIFLYDKMLKAGNLNHEIDKYYSFDIDCEGSVDKPDYLAIAEWLNLRDWLIRFPSGILSYVADTFDLWKLINYILPRLKTEIMVRDGKLVIRPDSGKPVDIICGHQIPELERTRYAWNTVGQRGFIKEYGLYYKAIINNIGQTWELTTPSPEQLGVIQLLWNIFGGTVNKQGCKVLDPHIGCIYGDAINLDRQIQIYERLFEKKYAATNIVLGIGSFTYQYNSRDSLGFAAKGAYFEVDVSTEFNKRNNQQTRQPYNIYKDPITDNGTKKSLKGLIRVNEDFTIKEECTWEEENGGLLQVIYEDGKFYNHQTLEEIRTRINKII